MSVSKKEIETELQKLATEYKQAGFKKLAGRLEASAVLFKTAEESAPATTALAVVEEKVDEVKKPTVEAKTDPLFEVEADAGEEETEEEDEVEGEGEDGEDEEDPEEQDADAEMDEDIAMRDACTKIYRAAKSLSKNPSPKVRILSERLLKVERMIRSTL